MRPDGSAALALPDEPAEGYAGPSAEAVLDRAIRTDFPGEIALVSSFGAASVVLLDMVARIDPSTPVVILDTGKLFGETLAYRDALVARLGLSDVRCVYPDPAGLAARDADGRLHARDAGACCAVRKVAPLERAVAPFSAWITGRRRGQTLQRDGLAVTERDPAGRLKINPLADWSREAIAARMAARGLPAHPLVARGYASIGCAPCTTPVADGEDERAGRWRGTDREECGIHLANGRLVRLVPTG